MLAGDIQGRKEEMFFVIKNKSHKKSEDDKKKIIKCSYHQNETCLVHLGDLK